MKKEILWILASLLIAIISSLLLGFDGNSSIDINIHDTYFVLERWTVITLLFCLSLSIIFVVRCFAFRFRRIPANVILLMALAGLVYIFWILSNLFSGLNSGWTVYPPLSSIPGEGQPEREVFSQLPMAVDITLVLLNMGLMTVAYVTGLKMKNR